MRGAPTSRAAGLGWARLGSAGAGLQRLFAGWQEPLVVEAAQPWPRQLGSSVLPWS